MAATTPEWLARTREVCFGASRDSLPQAGGWVLLIGEPLGLLSALIIGWGAPVREGLAFLRQRWRGRLALAGVLLALAGGAAAAAGRVASVGSTRFDPARGSDPVCMLTGSSRPPDFRLGPTRA
jgi:hypothetical protein